MTYQLRDVDSRLHGIHVDTARGVDDIQNYATNRARTESVDEYENALIDRTSNLKGNINGQLDDLHQSVVNKRPSPNDRDYEQKRENYRQLLVHANNGIGSLKDIFSRLFFKLFEVVKSIVKWVCDHLPHIVSAIATIFSTVILPLLGVMWFFAAFHNVFWVLKSN